MNVLILTITFYSAYYGGVFVEASQNGIQRILDPNLKIVSVRKNQDTDDIIFESFTPTNWTTLNFQRSLVRKNNSKSQRKIETNFYLDVLNEQAGNNVFFPSSDNGHLTKDKIAAVVELAIVCDNDFVDRFQYSVPENMHYFEVYFWDVAMKFKSLPSSDINIHITGLVLMQDRESQPFIENARQPDDTLTMFKVLKPFSKWIVENMVDLPNFDIAMLVTNTIINDGIAGVAYGLGTACSPEGSTQHSGTSIVQDDGRFQSVVATAHEIAHLLGASHDTEPHCSDTDYVMASVRSTSPKKFYFSECSDELISNYLRSDAAGCLKQNDGIPVIEISHTSLLNAPTMEDQCKKSNHLNDKFIGIWELKNTSICSAISCVWEDVDEGNYYGHIVEPVDNTPCSQDDGQNGQCFCGRCIPQMFSLKNLDNELWILPKSSFEGYDEVVLGDCLKSYTPLGRFIIINNQSGSQFLSPYASVDANEIGEKCMWTSDETEHLYLEKCHADSDNPWYNWNLVEVGEKTHIIMHNLTSRCVKAAGGKLATSDSCKENDMSIQWQIE